MIACRDALSLIFVRTCRRIKVLVFAILVLIHISQSRVQIEVVCVDLFAGCTVNADSKCVHVTSEIRPYTRSKNSPTVDGRIP